MLSFFLSQSVNVAIIALLMTALKAVGIVQINPKWSLVSLALFASYSLALGSGGEVIPVEVVIPDPDWNWGGKVLAIVLCVVVLFAMARVKEDFRAADAGFTLKQSEASTKPALIGLGLFILLQILAAYLDFDWELDYDTEELWFQALMPGLDEEPWFRGLLLYSSSLAVTSGRIRVFGAQINMAGLMVTALFGLVHGLMFDGRDLHFSAFAVLLTGLYGFILLWFRERTGSLVFPIIAHNAVNFVGQFELIPG